MTRKKILFISRWYPDRYDNMLGLFVQKHAVAIQELNDVSCIYITADTKLPSGQSEVFENEFEGVYEIRIYFAKSSFHIINAFKYFWYYRKAFKLAVVKKGMPDVVHSHILTRTAFPAFLLKLTKGIPYIITEHWSRYLPVNISKGAFKGFLRRWFTRLVVRNAAAVTTVTENLANAMRNLGMKNDNWIITPNVVDTASFYPDNTSHKNRAVKQLVHVSCFDEPAKNIKGIIDVVVELFKDRNDFILNIVGDGRDFSLIKDYGDKTGLTDKQIFFKGLLLDGLLTEIMREADVFIMFSNYENLPCTIIESMASGVPVISTDVGGIAEHLAPQFGILIRPNDKTALKNAILEALDHPEKFQKEEMREYAVKHFSNQEIGHLFDSLYTKSVSK